MSANQSPIVPTIAVQPIIVVGGANLDILGQAHSRLAAGDSTPGHIQYTRGGVGRNVAENLARLGLPTRLFTRVGLDDGGQRLCDETRASGVDTAGVGRSADLPTAQYLSLVQPDGTVAMALNDMRVLDQLTPTVLQAAGLPIAQARLLVLDCNLRADTLAWLADQASGLAGLPGLGSLPVVVDGVSAVKCLKAAPLLSRISVLKINKLEACALTGRPVDTVADAHAATRDLWRRGVGTTVLSLGGDGVSWCDAQGEVGHAPAHVVDVVNTNGAGDALLAGVIYGLVVGMPWPNSIQFGLGCAAITLQSSQTNADELTPHNVNLAVVANQQQAAQLGAGLPKRESTP